MSLILDALRKADAERQQGKVPDLHAQPVSLPAAEQRLAIASSGLVGRWWAALAAAAAMAAAVAWALWPQPPSRPAESTKAADSAPAAPDPPVNPETQTAPTMARPPAPLAAAAAPAIVAKAPPAPAAPRRETASAPLPRLEALAPELRAKVPALSVDGSVHSPEPSSRLLILNGQVLREGDFPAPGVKLETIGRKAAVLSVDGRRFELPL